MCAIFPIMPTIRSRESRYATWTPKSATIASDELIGVLQHQREQPVDTVAAQSHRRHRIGQVRGPLGVESPCNDAAISPSLRSPRHPRRHARPDIPCRYARP